MGGLLGKVVPSMRNPALKLEKCMGLGRAGEVFLCTFRHIFSRLKRKKDLLCQLYSSLPQCLSVSRAQANVHRHALCAAIESLFLKFSSFNSFYYFSKTEASTSAQTGMT